MAKRYPRDTLELTVEGMEDHCPRSLLNRNRAERLMIATLVWPRPLIAERIASRSFRFQPEGLDLSNRDWSERILFKERVEGPFGLIVQVTEPLSSRDLRRATAVLGQTLLKTAGSELARVAAGPWLTALARFPFTYLTGELSDAGKTPKIVAAGRRTLLPGASGPVEIPLLVPEDIVRTRRQRVGGRTRTRRETIARKGDPAGTVRLAATYYQG